MSRTGLPDDFVDLLTELNRAHARYLLVGAHAMAVHGIPRATGDIDIWIDSDSLNARRVLAALERFGAPVAEHGIGEADLTTPDTVYQIGLPPRRIDLLTSIDGVAFDEAWVDRVVVQVEGLEISVIGRRQLIQNKRASGRDKDLLDLKTLESPSSG